MGKARYPKDVPFYSCMIFIISYRLQQFKSVFFYCLTSSLSFILDPSNCMLAEAKLEGKIWLRKLKREKKEERERK